MTTVEVGAFIAEGGDNWIKMVSLSGKSRTAFRRPPRPRGRTQHLDFTKGVTASTTRRPEPAASSEPAAPLRRAGDVAISGWPPYYMRLESSALGETIW